MQIRTIALPAILLCMLLAVNGTAFAAPPTVMPHELPAEDKQKQKYDKEVTLQWGDTGVAYLVLSADFDQSGVHKIESDATRKKLKLTNKDGQIVVVPADKTKAPVKKKVTPKTPETITVMFDDIADKKMVHWGYTPKDPCPNPNPYATSNRLKVKHRMLDNKQERKVLEGPFLWTINHEPKSSDGPDRIAKKVGEGLGAEGGAWYRYGYFENIHDKLKSVHSNALEPMQNGYREKQCEQYTGGECSFVHRFGSDKRQYGHHHRMTFETKNKDSLQCPI